MIKLKKGLIKQKKKSLEITEYRMYIIETKFRTCKNRIYNIEYRKENREERNTGYIIQKIESRIKMRYKKYIIQNSDFRTEYKERKNKEIENRDTGNKIQNK